MKNFIIGGEFTKNPWQQGTSITGITSSTYQADRFTCSAPPTAQITISKAADAPSVAQCGVYTNSSLMATVTTPKASLSATDTGGIAHVVEGFMWSQVYGLPFTVSFWAKSNNTGVYCLAARDSGNTYSYVSNFTVGSSSLWLPYSVPIPAIPAGGSENFTNGSGLKLFWTYACGSTFASATNNTWNTGNFLATSSVTNLFSSNGNTFQIDLIQLEIGLIATSFETQTEQQVLSDCQRYFFKTFPQGITPQQNVGNANGAVIYLIRNAGSSNDGISIRWPVTMRAAPTLTNYNPNAANAFWRNITQSKDGTSATSAQLNQSGALIQCSGGTGFNKGDEMAIHLTASANF